MADEPLIAGRYRLLELLGSGGEAEVYRVRDEKENKDAALRRPRKEHREAVAIPELPFHPGWVRLFDAGVDPDHGPFQVLELLEGETLREVAKRGPLDDAAWKKFITQSLDAVGALHAAGWVHGDLNADNFFLAGATWKLLELPFLRLAPEASRSTIFGSIHSLSPEQLHGQPADTRSDLYALGCLYYYAATGAYPQPGGTRQEVVIGILRFPPVPLLEKSPGRDPALAAWVMSLLERDPQKRAANAVEARSLLG